MLLIRYHVYSQHPFRLTCVVCVHLTKPCISSIFDTSKLEMMRSHCSIRLSPPPCPQLCGYSKQHAHAYTHTPHHVPLVIRVQRTKNNLCHCIRIKISPKTAKTEQNYNVSCLPRRFRGLVNRMCVWVCVCLAVCAGDFLFPNKCFVTPLFHFHSIC